MKVLQYIKNRIGERSTWAGISASIVAAAAVAAPYSYVLIAIGVLMAVIPESHDGDGK